MSKSLGNSIDPLHLIHGSEYENFDAIARLKPKDKVPAFGSDVLRASLLSYSLNVSVFVL